MRVRYLRFLTWNKETYVRGVTVIIWVDDCVRGVERGCWECRLRRTRILMYEYVTLLLQLLLFGFQ